MAKGIVERTTGAGERRLYVTVWAKDRSTGNPRKVWVLVHGGIKDAEKRQREIKTALDQNGGLWPLDPPAAPADTDTVRAWCSEWVEKVDVRDSTRNGYRQIFAADTGLVAAIGDLPLGDVTKAHVRAWMAERAQAGAARLTIRNNLAPVRAAFADAIEDGKIRDNPCTVTRRRGRSSAIPGKAPRKVRAPEPELVAKVLDVVEDEFRLVLLLGAACGLRRGETFGLRWSDVAADSRTLTIRRANLRGRIVEVKTEGSERDVPLFATVRRELLAHKLRSRFTDDDDLIFPDPVGRPQYPGTIVDRELQAAFKKAGLPARSFHYHQLRHYAVTQARRVGKLDLLVIQRIAGHSQPSTTLDVYSDLFESDIADAADAFDPLTIKEAING